MRRVPSVSWTCTVLSSRVKNEKPVLAPRRIDAEPRCSSARESWSAHSLSPVVMGRFTTAETQSSVPAGSKETEPSATLRRAMRPGGSSWSAAARCGIQKAITSAKAIRLTNLRACFLITTFSPETQAEQDWACRRILLVWADSGLNAELKYALYWIPERIGQFGYVESEKARFCLELLNTCEKEEL